MPYSSDMREVALFGYGKFFLVRPRGHHPATGEKYVPTVVQCFNHELFTPKNEIDPIIWSKKNSRYEPTTKFYDADLEWCPLPE